MQSRSIQDAFMKQSRVDNQGCQESIRTGSDSGYSSLDLNVITNIQAATPGPFDRMPVGYTFGHSLGGVASCTLRSYGVSRLGPSPLHLQKHLQKHLQVRRVDQTRYPMTVVASLSAVPQSCRTPLHYFAIRNYSCYQRCTHTHTHTHPLSRRATPLGHRLPAGSYYRQAASESLRISDCRFRWSYMLQRSC